MRLYKVSTRDGETFYVHAVDSMMALIAVDQLWEIKWKRDTAVDAQKVDDATVMRPL